VAKGLEKLLAGGGRVEVWTSPALRSRQTADIIALQLGVSTVREEAAIYARQPGEPHRRVVRRRQRTDGGRGGPRAVSGIWVRQLTNATVPFKKCSAAGITLTPPDFSAGTLRWFAGAKVLTSLGESKD
jgi:hypothetical protein